MKKLSLFLLTLACVFQFSAQAQERPSYIAIEANSGKLLFSSNAEEKRPVASLSQVATAMVALDWVARTRLPLDTFIAVPQEAFGLRAGNPMDLQPGDRLTLRDALYSTLLGSDNVSALTVASFVGRDLVSRRGGGAPIAAFVAEMNKFGPFPEDGQNALYRSPRAGRRQLRFHFLRAGYGLVGRLQHAKSGFLLHCFPGEPAH